MQRCSVTRHVHHPAVALTQNLKSLAAQAAGADTVGIVTRDHLLTGGAAVPPWLGQIGQLHTERESNEENKEDKERGRQTERDRNKERMSKCKLSMQISSVLKVRHNFREHKKLK